MDQNYQIIFPAVNEVELREVDVPPIKEGHLLVKTTVSQISTGTELSTLKLNCDEDSEWRLSAFPKYPGYSNAGVVLDVGEGVDRGWIGKRVLSYGNHAAYNCVEASETIAIPDGVTDDEAVFGILGEICTGGIRIANMQFGDVVVVYGAGLVGQLTARLAKTAGSNLVFVVDISDFRLSKVPADPCFVPINGAKESVVDVILAHNGGRKADVVFETTGMGGDCVNDELKCLDKLGKLIILSSPKHRTLIDLFMYCCSPAVSIIGAGNYATHPDIATPNAPWTRCRDRRLFLEMLRNKRFDVQSMITHQHGFREAVSVYQALSADTSEALGVHFRWQ